ncbi:MAG: nucleotidyltransferase substrate binding protein [Methylomonas sp.]|jgi:hypothetical protein|uniref:nucleotidyltransferase substrate binding protein n=1 Tax=Methylomonas sp. TaxID=418 RepID=UPI0025E9CC9C|nr:nucleotidyltransferase substrate binding protein [Methylomonas sp.]MCK9607904.1 nucleotidyltransferase substrate binding protein [Methylomonas sp.]
MNQLDIQQLTIAAQKYQKVFLLLSASINKTSGFEVDKAYTADELEPFDALSDRFIRIVEVAIKLFRTYEYYMQAQQSQTLRDSLHQMEKAGLISDIDIWLDMRDVRNRIVHDYIPEKIAEMYLLVRTVFYRELALLNDKVNDLLKI